MAKQSQYNDKDGDIFFLEERSINFLKFCQGRNFSLREKQNIILDGRRLANNYLDLYKGTFHTKLLFNILEIYEIISQHYPKVIKEEMSTNELVIIHDKCKYFLHLILVLFHLNEIGRVKYELMAFRAYLKVFSKYIRNGSIELYNSTKELYHSFTHISVFKENNVHVNIYNRIGFQKYELEPISISKRYVLNIAVIIGSCATQVTLTGITIDMFRISQAIESKVTLSPEISNARKFMFYDKHFWDVDIGINDALNSMPANGILLLYVSGDAYKKKDKNFKNKNVLFKFGIKMKQEENESIEHSKIECLYPGDVATFLVVPTLLIIDSESSQSFQELYRHTDEAFMFLLSPSSYPSFIELSNSGKLFTLFLTSPQTAFCWICHKERVESSSWETIIFYLNDFMLLLINVVKGWYIKLSSDKIALFMDDRFSRIAMLRYLFCMITLRLHSEFINDDYYPKSNFTSLESEVLANKKLQSFVYKMASVLEASSYFIISDDLSLESESIDVEK